MQKWNIKGLIICHALVVFLLGTFLWHETKVHFWDKLDQFFFRLLNDTLESSQNWRLFWAFANHRYADWLEDVIIAAFFAIHIRQSQKELRFRKASQLVFCIFYIAAILYFINRMLFRIYLQIPRESPTLALDGGIRLSDYISWLNIKDDSLKSFPGDHATTAILFAASFYFFAPRRLGIIACIYGAFLCLPRLITGAHWLSDVVVGSGSIALFFLGWAFCSPLHIWFTDKLEKMLRFFSKLRRNTYAKES